MSAFVLSPGIEPRPVAPQATVLSIKLRELQQFVASIRNFSDFVNNTNAKRVVTHSSLCTHNNY